MRPLLPALALALASGILPGCRESYRSVSIAGVLTAMPDKPERGRLADPASGYLERGDATLAWDVDARTGPLAPEDANLPAGPIENAQVAGHPALLVRTATGAALAWRCDKTGRLFRLSGKDAERIAAHTNCHATPLQKLGEVPTAASAVLGPSWRLGNRDRASISWLSDDAVLTLFAGQQLLPPRDEAAAQKAAPEWVAAAGLRDVQALSAQPAQGPQGHPALEVGGTATLQGRPVRWTLLFWRCLQRQRSFAALVFSERGGDEAVLRAPRCHG